MKVRFAPISEIVQKDDIIPNGTVQEQAAEEEVMFLNLMLHNKDLLQETFDSRSVTQDHFFWEQNARLYSIIIHTLIVDGSLLTRDNMYDKLRNSQNYVASEAFYNRVDTMRVSPEDYHRLKRGLIDRYLQQRFYEITASNEDGVSGVSQILDATRNQGKLIAEFQEKLATITADAQADEFTRVNCVGDIMDDVLEGLRKRREDPEEARGLLTGFAGIDGTLYGFRPGDYGIVVGCPNGGKTTMMFNLAIGMADHGARVCYVTVESTEKEMTERMVAREAKVPLKALRRGGTDSDGLSPERWNRIVNAGERIRTAKENFTFLCVPQKTCITTVLSLVGARHRLTGFDVVFLDYLDVISPEEENTRNPYLDINCVSVAFQAFIKKSGLVGITAQSFNNEAIKLIKKQQEQKGENGDLTAVGLEGIGGSQKLSRDADYIWGLVHLDKIGVLDVYWLKSRFTAKEKRFRLVANLEYCHLVDENRDCGACLFADDEEEGAGAGKAGHVSNA